MTSSSTAVHLASFEADVGAEDGADVVR